MTVLEKIRYVKLSVLETTLYSYEFDSSAGFAKMQGIVKTLHEEVDPDKQVNFFAGKKIKKTLDYSQGLNGLSKSDVLKYLLEGNCSMVVRPSGTEPKLKTHISVSTESREKAEEMEKEVVKGLEKFLH